MRSFARRCLLALSLACGLFGPGVAHGETPPSVWDSAKDPLARDRYRLHLEVQELLEIRALPEIGSLRNLTADRARVMLEAKDAAHSPDPRLRFDLAEVYELLERYDAVIGVLEGALAMAPDHPAATRAWFQLAGAYAHKDSAESSRKEISAYREFLARETDDEDRAIALLNLAEAEMHLGEMERSITDYQESLHLAASSPRLRGPETEILAVWGLAVAYDRSGDATGAAAQSKLATQMDARDIRISDKRYTFFVPEYERNWYLGLAAMAHARDATDPRVILAHWVDAEQRWESYLAGAERLSSGDRWIVRARSHRDFAKAQRVKAAARVAKLPPPLRRSTPAMDLQIN
ncbi:MAG: tetratricopeptide repeat protein [Polyangiaceae bacterium]